MGITKVVKDVISRFTLDIDINLFVQGSLAGPLSESGLKDQCQIGHQIHTSRVDELFNFEYHYFGKSWTRNEYILILKNGIQDMSIS